MRLKRWESPRRQGRNNKGKGGAARQRQLKKQQQMMRKKLKGEPIQSQKRKPKNSKNPHQTRKNPIKLNRKEEIPILFLLFCCWRSPALRAWDWGLGFRDTILGE